MILGICIDMCCCMLVFGSFGYSPSHLDLCIDICIDMCVVCIDMCVDGFAGGYRRAGWRLAGYTLGRL